MDINSFVIGHNKGYKQGRAKGGFLSMEENDAGGMTYELAGTESRAVDVKIAYGDEPPEDTSKLWVKTSKPSKVKLSPNKPIGEGSRDASIEDLGDVSESTMATWSSARVENKIYLFGGTATSPSSSIFCYNISTNTTSVLTETLPYAMSGIGCAAIGTKIYLFGGGTTTTNYPNILIFDTETETIADTGMKVHESTKYGCYTSVAAIGTNIYYFGGAPCTNTVDSDSTTICGWAYCFNTISNTQTFKAYILGHYASACVAIGTNIYIIGGRNSSYSVDTVICYDTETDTYTTLPYKLPSASCRMGCSVVNNKIYLFGGDSVANHILCVDPEAGTVIKLGVSMPDNHTELTAVAKDDVIYVLGLGNQRVYKFYAPLVDIVVNNNIMHICSDPLADLVTIINTDNISIDIGVSDIYKGNSDNIGKKVEAYLYKNDEWTLI
jgi:hypothetical protein